MSPERLRNFFSRASRNSHETKEKSSDKNIDYAKRVVNAAFHLLEGTRLDQVKGRMVVVKVPKSKHMYHIIDLSGTDRVKEEIKNGNQHPEQRKLVIYSLKEPYGCYVSFPLPFKSKIETEDDKYRTLWSRGPSFDNSKMRRFARHLEKAVPLTPTK